MAFDLGILNLAYGGNALQDYLAASAAFLATMIFLKVFKFMIIKRLKILSSKTRNDIDDLLIKVIDDVRWPFFAVLSVFAALQFIQVPGLAGTVLFYVVLISGTYYVVRGLHSFIDFGKDKITQKRREEEDTSVVDFLGRISKIILWFIAVLFVVSNLGYNITPMIAGLGLGGLAVAFALQSILGDVFASLSLYFDKPFKTGDFIIVGDDMGVVKNIGIKSTRIETLQGQELIMPNKELTETRVNNYKRMEKRRVVFNFGVVYQTPTEKMKKIPGIVKDIIDKIELAGIDRVHFNRFGDSSLDFEVVYYLNTNDYNAYMDIQQDINLAIKEQFEKEGIEMAYPTRTVYMKS